MEKVVIITGSSQGIGAATALKAAAAGYQVCVNYLQNKPAALAIVHAIKKLGQEAGRFGFLAERSCERPLGL
ncbi:SDR family NAD(P)-dependent oxidoreductase [Piscirickettsia salmonis]|uniref:SDR family NAD(P)-dependent oxidoreductase n=1 Tax=Piscirickettsia salmonis TaxID=1238 RepID=UPI00080F969B|nr:SDR family NAD(P)-dependent oxidoreductase [Piscirickettsia salmonis]